MATIYRNGIAPIVTTFGPGNLHHLSYDVTVSGLSNIMGFIPTTNQNTTNFVLGSSYAYAKYAFYWDGVGEAFWRLGSSSVMQPVGNSWTSATGVPVDGEVIMNLNVATQAAGAVDHGDGRIVAYEIPIDLCL